ncbi:hypothetical protein ABK040_008079 [Willaertia magna]
MVLWVDKHRPTTLDNMQIHKDISTNLKNIVSTGDFPHLLIYGPSGAGKKTRIHALIKQLYGSKGEKVKLENKEVPVGSTESKTVTVTVLTSNHHIELTPSESGSYDRYVIANMIKEIAETDTVGKINTIGNASSSNNNAQQGIKVIVLHEVDSLTREAQQALRRIMEKYSKNCRLILCATSTSKVIPPIRSRCLSVRIPAPTEEDIETVLKLVAKKENINLIPEITKQICENCDRNLRRAILMLESAKIDQYPFKKDQKVKLPAWEKFIEDIAKSIIQEQSPNQLLKIRDDFYLLLTNCISPETILKQLLLKLLELNPSDEQSIKLVNLAAIFEHRMKCGSNPIFHLEAFVAKVMTMLMNSFSL